MRGKAFKPEQIITAHIALWGIVLQLQKLYSQSKRR